MLDRSSLRRQDIEVLKKYGLEFGETWEINDYFEKLVAEFFGAPYAVAVDSCTHAIELSLRICQNLTQTAIIPKQTYMSVPMTLDKLGVPYVLQDIPWQDYYTLDPYPVIDAAVAWQQNSYVSGTRMCLSFQFKKHLCIGRGGMILLDNANDYERLHRLAHDGRNRRVPWPKDTIVEPGYHYYMTPEDAARGIDLFHQLFDQPRLPASITHPQGYQDYIDLTIHPYFKQQC